MRSLLLNLVADGLSKDPDLSGIEGYVDDTGEGRVAVDSAIECAVPIPVSALALFRRFRSCENDFTPTDTSVVSLKYVACAANLTCACGINSESLGQDTLTSGSQREGVSSEIPQSWARTKCSGRHVGFIKRERTPTVTRLWFA